MTYTNRYSEKELITKMIDKILGFTFLIMMHIIVGLFFAVVIGLGAEIIIHDMTASTLVMIISGIGYGYLANIFLQPDLEVTKEAINMYKLYKEDDIEEA